MNTSQSFKQRLLYAGGLLGGVQVFRLVALLLRNKLLAVWLGPAGLGVLSQLNGVADVATLICTAGFGAALARFVAADHGQPTLGDSRLGDSGANTEKRPPLPLDAAYAARTALRWMAAASCAMLLVLVVLRAPLSQWFAGSPRYAVLLAVVALSVPLNAWYLYTSGLLQGEARVRSQAVQSASQGFLWLLCGAALAWRGGLAGGIWGILAAWGLTAPVSWWLLRRARLANLAGQNGPLWRRLPHDGPATVLMLRFGSVALVGALVPLLMVIGTRASLLHFGGETAGGLYQVPISMSNLTYALMTTALSGFVLPHVYRHVHDRAKLHSELESALILVLAFMTPSVIGLMCLHNVLAHTLFSTKFTAAAPMIAPQLCADWLHALVWWLALPLLPAGLYAAAFACDAFALLLTVGLAWLLLPHFGLSGATLAAAVAQLCVLLPLWLFRARRDGLRLKTRTWILLLGCCCAVFATAWYTG